MENEETYSKTFAGCENYVRDQRLERVTLNIPLLVLDKKDSISLNNNPNTILVCTDGKVIKLVRIFNKLLPDNFKLGKVYDVEFNLLNNWYRGRDETKDNFVYFYNSMTLNEDEENKILFNDINPSVEEISSSNGIIIKSAIFKIEEIQQPSEEKAVVSLKLNGSISFGDNQSLLPFWISLYPPFTIPIDDLKNASEIEIKYPTILISEKGTYMRIKTTRDLTEINIR